MRYLFSSPALTRAIEIDGRDPFTCLSGDADKDSFLGHFAGRELRLTAANATAALRAFLTKKYAAAFTRARVKWVTCPAVEFEQATSDSPSRVACEFEFGKPGSVYRGGETTAYLVGGEPDVASGTFHARVVHKNMIACLAVPKARSGWVNGVSLSDRVLVNTASLGDRRHCEHLVGGAGMVADVETEAAIRFPTVLKHLTVGFHGTNRAGFSMKATFPCRVKRSGSRYAVTCRNRLGDAFIYRFTVNHNAP